MGQTGKRASLPHRRIASPGDWLAMTMDVRRPCTGQGNHEGCPYVAGDRGSPPHLDARLRGQDGCGVYGAGFAGKTVGVRLDSAVLRIEGLDSSLRVAPFRIVCVS